MRSILLSDSASHFSKVYNPISMERMKTVPCLDTRKYTSKDILAAPDSFADVENIFSTWGMPNFSEQQIRKIFPNLKCVFYAAGSVQAFARPFLACGVRIFSAWGSNAVSVAEYTVAQIILACKGYFALSALLNQKKTEIAAKQKYLYHGVYGEKVGIIGCGMIGSLVAEMLREHGMELLAFDPFMSEEKAARLNVRKASLESLFAECSVVSNHLANKKETEGILRYSHFSSMRPYSTFINTGRGAQVVESDLVQALTERPDITALLDVTYPEPAEPSHRFYTLPNCFLTPHIAGSILPNDQVRMVEYMIEEYRSYTAGTPCRYEITEKMLETMA